MNASFVRLLEWDRLYQKLEEVQGLRSLAAQTGLRVSEIIDLNRDPVVLGHGAHVRCVGKGRKERSTALTKVAQQALRGWLNEPRKRGATALFPNMHGGGMLA
ncbi:tyrosine-type recombinase/integrase [Mesorhizobium sp. M0619]